MKKIFPLEVPGKENQRVLELVRSEVGKYLNREKRKALPEGCDLVFDCRIGVDAASSVATEVGRVPLAINQVAAAGAKSVYVEIIASARPKAPPSPTVAPESV